MVAPPLVCTMVGRPDGPKCAEAPLVPWNSGRGPAPGVCPPPGALEPNERPGVFPGVNPRPGVLAGVNPRPDPFGDGPPPVEPGVAPLRPDVFGTVPRPALPGVVFCEGPRFPVPGKEPLPPGFAPVPLPEFGGADGGAPPDGWLGVGVDG
jgi:hypothetical protein